MTHPLHILAAALGASPSDDGCICAVCGPSPFGVGRPSDEVFGPLFVDFDLVYDSRLPNVCAGCAGILGGKPSRENPPLRMGHFAVVGDVLERPDGARLVELLRGPEQVRLIGWTRTRQKHASLRARTCSSGDVWVATEDTAIRWDPEHVVLLDAVASLRTHATGDHILTGHYPPHVVSALGARWEPAEATVARHRPSTHLDLACAVVRRPETIPEPEPMVGIARRLGAGEVVRWSCVLGEHDPMRCLVRDNGTAARALPSAWVASTTAWTIGAHRGPYWHPEAQTRVARVGAAVQLHPEVGAAVEAMCYSTPRA